MGECAKELGRRWEQCQCREKYEEMAICDKERHAREMAEFKAGTFVCTKRAKMNNIEGSGAPAAVVNDGHANSESEDDDDEEESLGDE